MRHAKPAESLIETLIAITVIVLATTAAMSVLRTATTGNEIIGKKVIAMNLAVEGFEALRNLRDTNYLLFSSDPDECWNKINATDISTCSSATEITDGFTYYLTRSFTTDPFFKWTLARQTTTSQGYLTLFELDIDGGSDWESQMYAQSTLASGPTITSDAVNRRLFRRLIAIDCPTSCDDYYNATITITWTDHNVSKTLTLTRSIANVY